MITKRLPFHASTLCAGGTLLVLGGFLALNLAGCGGSNGGLVTPTAIPGTTATPVPATLQFFLQTTDGTAANGGSITLTSSSGRVYTANANSKGVAGVRNVIPGVYTLVFVVAQRNSATGQTTNVSTTRSITVSSPTTSSVQSFTLRQGDTGDSNPFTITGRVLLNPADTSDPDGTTTTANCSAKPVAITSALLITVRDLNSTNGASIIAQVVRPLQPTTTPGLQKGLYSISIPYRPRSLSVSVAQSSDNGEQFAGISASTTFPTSIQVLNNVDVCTNTSDVNGNAPIAPQPAVTSTPIPTPFATATTVGTPAATATATTSANPTAVPTAVPTATTAPTATIVPTNTPIGNTTTPTTIVTAPSTNPTIIFDAPKRHR